MDIKHIHFETIESTNSWAKDHYSSFDKKKLTVISTDHQTKGRGQFNRIWHSPPKKSLLLTFVFFTKKNELANVSQILALAAADTLKELLCDPKIKWPNDLFLNEKKVGGILTEISSDDGSHWVFAGIGLNINMDIKELSQIETPATSIKEFLQKECSIPLIFERLTRLFRSYLTTFLSKGFAPFLPSLQNYILHKKGDTLTIGKEKGQFKDIHSNGSLLLTVDGQDKLISTGEILDPA